MFQMQLRSLESVRCNAICVRSLIQTGGYILRGIASRVTRHKWATALGEAMSSEGYWARAGVPASI